MDWRAGVAAALAGMIATAGASAADLPPIPEKVEAEQFRDVPAPWRDYLVQARAAERMEDPLQRCLAFPDIPGNKWPAGHAEAHCRYHLARVLTLAEVDGYLQRDEAGKLEQAVAAALDKHFSEDAFSEDIHRFFELFEWASPETDRISASWLEKAPKSAFAQLARGAYFAAAARQARGGKWAQETPREKLQEMSRLAGQAIPLMRKAAKAEPRLMPAYALAINIAMFDSRPDVEEWAFQAARKQDPACVDVARRRMQALEPRWGGSYEAMLAYANELATLAPRRPMLALHQGAPFGDRGDRLVAADELTAEAAEILDIAVATGANEAYLHDAATVAVSRKDGSVADRFKGLAYLLQEARFNEGGAWADRVIGWKLLRSEPEWALRYLVRAEKADPSNAWGQYLLGAAFYNTRRHDEAQAHYLKAIEDSAQRQASLRELSTMWLYDAGLQPKQAAARAKPFVDRLRGEYPEDGRGLIYRIDLQAMENGGRLDSEALQDFLKVADRGDPVQKRYAEHIEAAFRKAGIKADIR